MNSFKNLLKFLFLLSSFFPRETDTTITANNTCILPSACQFGNLVTNRVMGKIICNRLDVLETMNCSEKPLIGGQNISWTRYIYFNLATSSPKLLDSSFSLKGLVKLLYLLPSSITGIQFNNLNGFEINSYKKNDSFDLTSDYMMPYFYFFNTKLNFFSTNRRLISSCSDYLRYNEQQLSLFQVIKPISIWFRRVYFDKPICPLVLNNSHIISMEIDFMINTYYKQNFIKFDDFDANASEIAIEELHFTELEKIDINSKLISAKVCKNLIKIELSGEINSIEKGLFNRMNKLKEIHFLASYFKNLAHKRDGIKWIESLNPNVDIFSANQSSLLGIKYILIHLKIFNQYYSSSFFDLTPIDVYFPNEDFCLYLDFFFSLRRLFFLTIDIKPDVKASEISCTFLWLIRDSKQINQVLTDANMIVYQLAPILKLLDSIPFYKMIEDCEFEKRFSYCIKSSNKPPIREKSLKDFSETMIIWQFSSIVMTPIICLIGIITNLIVVVVIGKENRVALKEKQYTYMMLRSIINSSILFIQSFSLLNQCQSQNGLFCSSVTKLLFVQYYKIVFVELFGNYLRLVSNLFYVAFSFNRLSLIGKDHDKLTRFLSELKPLYFVIFAFIVGFLLTFVKVFRFQPNLNYYSLDYPFMYTLVFSSQSKFGVLLVFTIFNIICDMVNGPGFLIASIVIDIVLARKMKATLDSKMAKKAEKNSSKN